MWSMCVCVRITKGIEAASKGLGSQFLSRMEEADYGCVCEDASPPMWDIDLDLPRYLDPRLVDPISI